MHTWFVEVRFQYDPDKCVRSKKKAWVRKKWCLLRKQARSDARMEVFVYGGQSRVRKYISEDFIKPVVKDLPRSMRGLE